MIEDPPKHIGPPEYEPPADLPLKKPDIPAHRPRVEPAVTPPTLDDFQEARNSALKRLMKNLVAIPTRDLPKFLDILNEEITKRQTMGDASGVKNREPTRAEMLEALQGKRPEPKP